MTHRAAGPSTPKRTIMQRFLQRLARLVADVFYRRTAIVGTPPAPDRAAILAVNHTNGLGDAVMVIARTRAFPRFLAAASWWKFAPARWLFDAAGVLPVHRRREGEDTSQNASSFTECAEALAGGAQIAIHPEGEMHDGHALLPLKTGAARIALEAAAGDVPDLVVVPYAVVYANRTRFRSEAALAVGPPIPVGGWVDRYRRDPEAAVRGLTDVIAAGLRAVTANHETARGARVVGDAARLARYAVDEADERATGFGPRHALMCRLAAAVEAAGGETGPAFGRLASAVDAHRACLDALGAAADEPPPYLDPVPGPERARATRERALLAPVAAFGAVLDAPVAAGLAVAARAARGPTWRATALGATGVVLAPVVWGAEAWAARKVAGRPAAVAVAVAAPFASWALLGWLDRSRLLRAAAWRDAQARRDPAGLDAALATRAEVARVVDRMLLADLAEDADAEVDTGPARLAVGAPGT